MRTDKVIKEGVGAWLMVVKTSVYLSIPLAVLVGVTLNRHTVLKVSLVGYGWLCVAFALLISCMAARFVKTAVDAASEGQKRDVRIVPMRR